jgi:hypothetical protein
MSGPLRRVRIAGQGLSGHSSDDGLGSKMDLVILIVRLITVERHDLLLSGRTMPFDHGVVNMSAIHTT